ncbi:MAG: spore coat associated protein CotJA [Clostridia bacterium]|nr:spore coat associated protein CotJA [Clostridia bacterium]
MVYSPYQNYEELYDPREGLCNGTIFCKLNKPFYGDRRI